MPTKQHDLIVIGGGPGGYVAAIRAAQLGLDTACIDENASFGGTCLRVGCIPSKAMLESSHHYEMAQHGMREHGVKVSKVQLDLATMIARKQGVVDTLTKGIAALFKKNKVSPYHGRGSLTKRDGRVVVRVTDDKGEHELEAEHIILATGSKPATLPGVDLTLDRVDTSTESLDYDQVPEHLAVIGGGYIGLELGTLWRRLGAKVTILEYLDRILPGFDSELASDAHRLFAKQGLTFELGSKVTGVEATKNGKQAGVKIIRDGADAVEADRVLVAVGRQPYTDGLGLDEAGVELDDRGRIKIDEHFRTTAEGVYAIGDAVPGPMLAHKAEEDGIACVQRIATGHGHIDYSIMPAVVYTHPELATVGKTEDELKESGVEYRKGIFPFLANGRARSLGDTAGKVKLLADAKTDRVLGVHILGPTAGELIGECAAAMAFGASAEDIARTCHAHPTLSEAVKEAAMGVQGGAIHV